MRIIISVFTALALFFTTAAGAETGLSDELVVASFSQNLVVPDRAESEVAVATTDDPAVASTAPAASPRSAAESKELQARKRGLFAFVLIAASTSRGAGH